MDKEKYIEAMEAILMDKIDIDVCEIKRMEGIIMRCTAEIEVRKMTLGELIKKIKQIDPDYVFVEAG